MFEWSFHRTREIVQRHRFLGRGEDWKHDKTVRSEVDTSRAAAHPHARHSQSDDLPRRCLAVGLSIHILPHLSPFILTVMISQFSAFLLRSICVAPLTRSRMLSMPSLASRTHAAIKARVGTGTQDTRMWHLTIVTVGLLSTVL